MTASFEIRPPYIVLHDNKPGNNVALRVIVAPVEYDDPWGAAALASDGDASSHSDSESRYAWAFEGAVIDGDRIIFSADDRVVLGSVADGKIVVEGEYNTRDGEAGELFFTRLRTMRDELLAKLAAVAPPDEVSVDAAATATDVIVPDAPTGTAVEIEAESESDGDVVPPEAPKSESEVEAKTKSESKSGSKSKGRGPRR